MELAIMECVVELTRLIFFIFGPTPKLQASDISNENKDI